MAAHRLHARCSAPLPARFPPAALFVLCVAGGCAAPKPTSPADKSASDAIVRAEQLPERERAVLDAWRRGGPEWELRREEVKKDPQLARFVAANAARAMVATFERSRLQTQPVKDGPFERAQAELVALKEQSVPLLVDSLRLPDGVVAFLAADVLVQIGIDAVQPAAALLDDARPETRRRAAELLGRLPALAQGEDQLLARLGVAATKDAEWIVRAQAAQSVALRGSQAKLTAHPVGVLCRALLDPDPAVAIAAAQGLALLADPRCFARLVDALEHASGRGEPKLVAEIETTLATLSGEARKKSPAQWRAWWEQNQKRLLSPAK